VSGKRAQSAPWSASIRCLPARMCSTITRSTSEASRTSMASTIEEQREFVFCEVEMDEGVTGVALTGHFPARSLAVVSDRLGTRSPVRQENAGM
jgi:hypothetical protein